ncbi:glutactin [Drosophila nasuta]|uniref:glutactin n=1 Tax=Drosophila nasuta TaxID=42062 RepID=UPI00295F530F|nr:glutactin [Drosophila nasuta]
MQLDPRILLLLLPLVGICHAQPTNSFHDWDVFTPQPLRPAPWQEEPTTQPPSSGGVQIPGVGEVNGLRGFKTIKNRPIDAFLGVRYAKVGTRLERFQEAKRLPYQGRIDATRSSPNCAQFPEVQRLQEAEARGENVDDCLTLNIYAPAGAKQLPVLVFVHGEMLFDGGAEEAQPDYVLEHDVVLVSVNYRLAPFGFLSALEKALPGNVALSDLQLALEWVKANIRYFGGDAEKVTLIGQAGGATLAHALSISPRTQDLFQQLILQSGTALNPYLLDEQPLETLTTFARLANCPPVNGRNLGSVYLCLSNLRTSQLVSAFQQLHEQNEPRGLSSLGGFKLVVGDSLGFLPEHPAALIANSNKLNKTKPLIVGAAKDASAFILSRFYDQIQSLQSTNISDYINVVLRHTAPPQQHKIWHDWAIREIFTPEQTRYVNARSVSQGLLELTNLILYRGPVIDSIRLSHKKNPTYLYTFDYRGEHHRFGHLDNPLPFGVDASLSDDSVYLFPYPEEVSNLNPEDKSLARALVAMWVNFAQSGIPNPNANVWPKATSEYGPFLRFTNSRQNILEQDQHFGEGINVPSLYPQLSAVAAPATTTTRRPYYRPQQPPTYQPQPPQQPNYEQQQPTYEQQQPTYQEQPQQPTYEQQQPTYQQQPPQQPTYQPQQPTYQQQPQQPAHQPQQPTYQPQQPTYQQQPPQQPTYEQQQPTYQQQPQQPAHQPQQPIYQPTYQRQQPTYQPLQPTYEQQPQQPQPAEPQDPTAPQQPTYYTPYYYDSQEQRRQQLLRELALKQREQQEAEQQQREELQRQEEERRLEQRQREEQIQREQLKLEQLERELRQREQQERDQLAIRQQEEREQTEQDQEQRENEARQQQEHEQRQREQQAREQQQRQYPAPSETEQQQQERQYQRHWEQEQRSQEERDQEARQQQEREQEEREQQQREQVAREQQERESQPAQPEGPNLDDFPSYEDYVKAYEQWIAEQMSRSVPQANVSAEQDAEAEESPVNNQYEPQYKNSLGPRRAKQMRRYHLRLF